MASPPKVWKFVLCFGLFVGMVRTRSCVLFHEFQIKTYMYKEGFLRNSVKHSAVLSRRAIPDFFLFRCSYSLKCMKKKVGIFIACTQHFCKIMD